MPEKAGPNSQNVPDSKRQKLSVDLGDKLSPLGEASHIVQNLGDHIRPADVMRLQRTLGNQATANLLKRSPALLPRLPAAPKISTSTEADTAVQRKTMIVKTGMISAGTHRVYGSTGNIIATVKGGEHLEIDDATSVMIKGGSAYKLVTELSAPKFKPTGRGFGLSEDGNYYIKSTNLTALNEPEAEAEGGEGVEVEADMGSFTIGYSDGAGTVAIPIGGQILSFSVDKSGAVSGKIAGEIPDKKLEVEIPGYQYSIDFPIPGVGAAYLTAGIEIAPTLEFGFGGGAYSLQMALRGGGDHTLDFNADVGGSLGLDVTAKAGVGVGAANFAGIDAGAFVTGSATAALGASLKGKLVASNADGWKSGTLTLEDIAAEMKIKGKAGAYIEAKAIGGMFSAKKKFTFLDKEIGVFKYERDPISIVKAGMEDGKLNLSIGDFVVSSSASTAIIDPDKATDRTPLLQSDQNAFNAEAH